MKVLFLSDTHLGFGRKHRDYPERRKDAFEGFSRALEVARRENIDVILHGGDLFHRVWPSFETLSEAVDLLASLRSGGKYRVVIKDLKGNSLDEREVRGIPFIAVHGNHDWNQNKENNIYTLLERAGLLIYAHRRKILVEGENGSICVVGMGWIPDRYVESVISSYPSNDCGHPAYFLFHQPVKGLYPSNPREKLIPPSLFPSRYDLYLGGHLHWIVDKTVGDKRFLIPGSTVITSLKEGEMDRDRIVYLIEGSSVRSVPLGVRKAYLVVAKTFNEAVKKIEELLSMHEGRPPIIKVVLEGNKEEDVDENTLRGLFRDRALIYLFDRRKEDIFQKIREFKGELSSSAFERRVVFDILRRRLGEEWSDWMEELINLLIEGKEEEAFGFLLEQDMPRNSYQRKGGTILDWVGE